MSHILVTGGGAPGAPGIIKSIKDALPSIRIFSCDAQSITAGRLLADDYFCVPLGSSPDYIPSLLDHCIKHSISTVLPITTRELIPLSYALDEFKAKGISVIISEKQPLTIANDKGKLYHHLMEHNIEVPKFKIASNYEQYLSAKEYLVNEKPFIIKPSVGNGSRGFRIVTDNIDESELLFNYKPNSTYLSESRLDKILSEKAFPEILLSEYLPGDEYTVDCLVENGRPLLIIPRKREKMNNGISVSGTIEKNREIIDYCKSILSTLKLHGPIGIQVKYSHENKPLIVEINPRIQGTTVACKGAGVNISALSVSPNLRRGIEDIQIKWGTKFLRHYEELYFSE